MEKRVLAFDYGASSGRAMLAEFDGRQINLQEIHRFSNDPVQVNGTLYWDILRLYHELKQGLLKAKQAGGFECIGIDTWGVDFGLLDEAGNLLENPVHYRDTRTAGAMQQAFQKLGPTEFYQETGIQFMEFNTVFQLYVLLQKRPELLRRAHRLLMIPDLLNYFLTGEQKTEYTIASTSQLLNVEGRNWSEKVLRSLELPGTLFTPMIQPGQIVSKLSDAVCSELGLPAVPVAAVPSHDTASAVAAVPASEGDFVYISCGTWSLMGTELSQPVVTERSYQSNITNEGGYGGTIRFLKNIGGLWLIQESRRQYQREGCEYSYADLENLALQAEPFRSFIDPDAPEFVPQGDLPGRVKAYCQRTGQPVPETVGQVMRCIYESLALKYRYVFSLLGECTQKQYSRIHLVGGGTKDRLLCQMAANACGVPVVAGPVEATVLGNVAVQLISLGAISGLEEARQVIAASSSLIHYEPKESSNWELAYSRFLQLL